MTSVRLRVEREAKVQATQWQAADAIASEAQKRRAAAQRELAAVAPPEPVKKVRHSAPGPQAGWSRKYALVVGLIGVMLGALGASSVRYVASSEWISGGLTGERGPSAVTLKLDKGTPDWARRY